MRLRYLTAVLALPFLVGFTWPAPQAATSPSAAVSKAEARTRIEVTNDNWNAVDVYLMRAGMAQRLGMVQTGSSRTFKMPRIYEQPGGDVRLVVEPIGPLYGYVSDPVIFSPGQRIQMNVEPDLFMSTVTVG